MSDLYDKQHDAEIVRLNDRITELEAQLKAAPFGDPYQGAREDLLMWKRDCEVLRQELDANKGALILSARKCKELEASLADSNEALQVMGLKLVHAEAENARLQKGLDAVASLIDESAGVAGLHLNGDIATWDSLRTGGSYEEWLMDFDAALNNQSHSANTVGGPTPVMDAAPACERKE